MIVSDFIYNSELELVLLTGGSISKEFQIQKAFPNLLMLRSFLPFQMLFSLPFHFKKEVSVLQGEDGKFKRKDHMYCNEPETRR